MRNKPVPRVPEENLPPYQCATCWYLEPAGTDHGICYGVPPPVMLDQEGDFCCPRPNVMLEDRGCHLWKSRHGTQ